MKCIDLRSDTVTRPSPAMRKAMECAPVGDDVYGEDPTVNRLEAMAAGISGMEAALFAPSGTQSNLIALMSHCQRGDEYIVGQQAHTYQYEGGGAAVLGSIQPQPIDFQQDGTLNLEKVEELIKPDDNHFARTRLLCLENTMNGKALPISYLNDAETFASKNNLRLHLDGARIFNAAVSQNVSPESIIRHVDSVSVCLSKGLGAPVGSLLCGSHDFIKEARRWRKMLGGGMRQAGLIAAAGIYALQHNIERLREDHENAEQLAENLSAIDVISVDPDSVNTNMVFLTMDESTSLHLKRYLASRGVLISGGTSIRLVTHMDITSEDIDLVTDAFKTFFTTH